MERCVLPKCDPRGNPPCSQQQICIGTWTRGKTYLYLVSQNLDIYSLLYLSSYLFKPALFAQQELRPVAAQISTIFIKSLHSYGSRSFSSSRAVRGSVNLPAVLPTDHLSFYSTNTCLSISFRFINLQKFLRIRTLRKFLQRNVWSTACQSQSHLYNSLYRRMLLKLQQTTELKQGWTTSQSTHLPFSGPLNLKLSTLTVFVSSTVTLPELRLTTVLDSWPSATGAGIDTSDGKMTWPKLTWRHHFTQRRFIPVRRTSCQQLTKYVELNDDWTRTNSSLMLCEHVSRRYSNLLFYVPNIRAPSVRSFYESRLLINECFWRLTLANIRYSNS